MKGKTSLPYCVTKSIVTLWPCVTHHATSGSNLNDRRTLLFEKHLSFSLLTIADSQSLSTSIQSSWNYSGRAKRR